MKKSIILSLDKDFNIPKEQRDLMLKNIELELKACRDPKRIIKLYSWKGLLDSLE